VTSAASSGAIRVGIFGASGYAGAELLRLCSAHPYLQAVVATGESAAGTAVADLYPSLAAAYPTLRFAESDPDLADGLDLVFLALPHGASEDVVPLLRKRVGVIVDLAADFRLKDPALYPRWYGEEHRHPELLEEAVFGLPELFRPSLPGATLIAAPGCHVTAAALALAPLIRAGAIESTGVVVDTITGVSGAGRAPKTSSHFCTVDEDVSAYGVLNHRHTPEIEQATGAQVLFTPHLAPMNRGILATCYARPTPSAGSPDPLGILRTFYADEPFIVVSERSPSTKATLGANTVHLTARFDERTGWILVLSALDNLVKGAAGQAVQCANLALGLPETAGLPVVGVYP
jgi:N-acetyl-gamma-glutamyl-phosphate reductase